MTIKQQCVALLAYYAAGAPVPSGLDGAAYIALITAIANNPGGAYLDKTLLSVGNGGVSGP